MSIEKDDEGNVSARGRRVASLLEDAADLDATASRLRADGLPWLSRVVADRAAGLRGELAAFRHVGNDGPREAS